MSRRKNTRAARVLRCRAQVQLAAPPLPPFSGTGPLLERHASISPLTHDETCHVLPDGAAKATSETADQRARANRFTKLQMGGLSFVWLLWVGSDGVRRCRHASFLRVIS